MESHQYLMQEPNQSASVKETGEQTIYGRGSGSPMVHWGTFWAMKHDAQNFIQSKMRNDKLFLHACSNTISPYKDDLILFQSEISIPKTH